MIKKHFPLFNGSCPENRIYFDNAATTQKPLSVIDAICNFYTNSNANVRRGLYPLGEQATILFEDVRAKVARFINAASSKEIVFTKGTTDGINLIAAAWALENLKPGDEILITQAEHHSNLLPWQMVTQKTKAILRFIPINTKTFLADYNPTLITHKTKLVAISHSSNVLGAIWHNNDLETLIKQARSVQAKILLDAAQSVAHQSIDVQKLDVDFLVFSGHKMFGPTGVGVAYLNKRIWDEMIPYQRGGSMVSSVDFEKATWAEMPHRFEAGTPPISSVIGLGAAVDFIAATINFEGLKKHEAGLCGIALDYLQKKDGIVIVGNPEKLRTQGHLISFKVNSVHPHDLASFLGNHGVCVRAGHHCAQPLVNLFGADTLVRISFSAYNTQDEVKRFVEVLDNTLTFFKNTL